MSHQPVSHLNPNRVLFVSAVASLAGLIQLVFNGLMPMPNVVGILTGLVILSAGVLVWVIRRRLTETTLGAYNNMLVALLFFIVALNGALGLGPAQYKPDWFLLVVFFAVGVTFLTLGLRKLRG